MAAGRDPLFNLTLEGSSNGNLYMFVSLLSVILLSFSNRVIVGAGAVWSGEGTLAVALTIILLRTSRIHTLCTAS